MTGDVQRAYGLAVLATMMWGANSVIARAASAEVTPVLATWLRFLICSVGLSLILRRRLFEAVPVFREQWKLVLAMTFGTIGFNCLMYLAAAYTGAANIAIFQGAIPLFVVVGAMLFLGHALTARLAIGVLAGGAGLLTVFGIPAPTGAQGVQVLLGDGIALAAMASYAVFILGVRQRRGVGASVFFGALCILSLVVSTPLMLVEFMSKGFEYPTTKGWLLILVSGLGASLAAQLAFIHSIDTLGPSRAGLFMNLIPIFGVLFSAVILGESITWLHVLGLGLILAGIVLAESRLVRVPRWT